MVIVFKYLEIVFIAIFDVVCVYRYPLISVVSTLLVIKSYGMTNLMCNYINPPL